jgi:tetratricopeptide (TPR) repeat protein
MKKRTAFTLFSVLLASGAFAHAADSLLQVLQRCRTRDTSCVMLLNRLCVALENDGEYDKAVAFVSDAIHLSDSLQYEPGQAVSHNNLGNCYNDMGNYKQSLEHHLLALSLREKLKDDPGIANSYLNTGNVYQHLGKFDEALDYYKRSLEIYKKLENKHGCGICYGNIGLVYNNKAQYKEAEDYYLRSIASKKEVGDISGVSDTYTNISIMYMDQDMYDKALENSLKALNMCAEGAHTVPMTTILSNLGDIYLHLKNYDACINYEVKAIEMAKYIKSKLILAESYRLAYNAYKAKLNHDSALVFYERFITTRDSILNEDNMKSINELHARFETVKKEKEIALLQKDKNIQSLEIERSNATGTRQTLWVSGITGGLIVILLSGLFILLNFRNRSRANRLLTLTNIQIQEEKNITEEKNSTITLGLNFAKGLQAKVLQDEKEMKANCGEHFLLFLPKDIVSGDFYFSAKMNGERSLITAVDCTGHGVPGALMSLHGLDLLKKIAAKPAITGPEQVLDELDMAIKNSVSGGDDTSAEKFGMDMAIAIVDRKEMMLEYAGARNPLYLVRGQGPGGKGELTELKADRVSIGSATEKFHVQRFPLQKGDMIYLFSDGFADQIGGPNRKKYLSGNFKGFLSGIGNDTLPLQKAKLLDLHVEWKGNFTQTDDILVIGIRV